MQKVKSLLKFLAWEVGNPLVLQLRPKRLQGWSKAFNGLSLGCGLDLPQDWIGIDGGVYVLLRRLPNEILRFLFPIMNEARNLSFGDWVSRLRELTVLHYDLSEGIPFASDVVPNIYSSHFFEHLAYEIAEHLARECWRVLRVGGRIRIAVPSLDKEVSDLRTLVEQYGEGKIEPVQRYLTTTRTGFVDDFSAHRHMYNFEEMAKLLSGAGFINIVQCDYRMGNIINIDVLDVRPSSLFVEAVKG